MNYYNENDPKAAAWLQELINQKLIPEGHVDTRSITEVTPDDLRPYIQCHFFAGIGGWPYALQLAGVPATTRLWTGSCPCQPFSTAGKGLAQADERHLWPAFFDLIRQCRPDTVIGEQVSSAIGHGWLDGISADLEAEGYACGATVLGAHSVSAPHQRQRLYWVANASSERRQQIPRSAPSDENPYGRARRDRSQPDSHNQSASDGKNDSGLAHSSSRERDERGSAHSQSGAVSKLVRCSEADGLDNTRRPSDERRGEPGDVGCPPDQKQGEARERQWRRNANSDSVQNDCGLVLPNSDGCSAGSVATATAGHRNTIEPAGFWIGRVGDSNSEQTDSAKQGQPLSSERLLRCWNSSRLVACRDGKTRRIPTEPAFFPLAHGVPARVVRLRGYGNAIVPQVAAAFIRAFYETQIQEANTDFC